MTLPWDQVPPEWAAKRAALDQAAADRGLPPELWPDPPRGGAQ